MFFEGRLRLFFDLFLVFIHCPKRELILVINLLASLLRILLLAFLLLILFVFFARYFPIIRMFEVISAIKPLFKILSSKSLFTLCFLFSLILFFYLMLRPLITFINYRFLYLSLRKDNREPPLGILSIFRRVINIFFSSHGKIFLRVMFGINSKIKKRVELSLHSSLKNSYQLWPIILACRGGGLSNALKYSGSIFQKTWGDSARPQYNIIFFHFLIFVLIAILLVLTVMGNFPQGIEYYFLIFVLSTLFLIFSFINSIFYLLVYMIANQESSLVKRDLIIRIQQFYTTPIRRKEI